jgi:hypothetical protein
VFTKLTNLILILAVGSSVAAGMPMHSGSSEPAMMDCCKKALEENGTPQVAAARLCCAMNCNEPGSTNGQTSQNFRQTDAEPTTSAVVSLPSTANYKSLRPSYLSTTSSSSKPAYILHLALLI